MNNENMDIYVFSGTGNSYRAAGRLQEIFIHNGKTARLFSLERSDPEKINRNNAFCLVAPAYNMSLPILVYNFIKKLPKVTGVEALAMITLGGLAPGALSPLKGILRKKGFVPLAGKEIIMPDNFFHFQNNPVKDGEKMEKGLKAVENFAEDIMADKAEWPNKVPVISEFMFWQGMFTLLLRKNFIGNKILGIKVKKDDCINCQLCLNLCPLRALEKGADNCPKTNSKCELCLRCTAICPTGAIRFNLPGRKQYQTLPAVELASILKGVSANHEES